MPYNKSILNILMPLGGIKILMKCSIERSVYFDIQWVWQYIIAINFIGTVLMGSFHGCLMCSHFMGYLTCNFQRRAPLSLFRLPFLCPLVWFKFDLIASLCSEILKRPLIMLQCIWLGTSNEELCVLYGVFRLCLNTSSGWKLVIKMMSWS